MLEGARTDHVHLDIHLHIKALNSLRDAGLVQEALSLVTGMKHFNVEPEIVAFNVLLDVCAEAGDLAAARHVFYTLMPAKDVSPNAVSYGAMIKACHMARQAGGIVEILKEVERLWGSLTVSCSTCLYLRWNRM